MITFSVDERISSTSFFLGDWPLSRIFLKNNANYPWLILVPREPNIQEIDQLTRRQQYRLMNEISALSSIVKAYFKSDKLNVGALGNIVSQLHVHVVARFENDALWPHGIWQAAQTSVPYTEAQIERLLLALRDLLKYQNNRAR